MCWFEAKRFFFWFGQFLLSPHFIRMFMLMSELCAMKPLDFWLVSTIYPKIKLLPKSTLNFVYFSFKHVAVWVCLCAWLLLLYMFGVQRNHQQIWSRTSMPNAEKSEKYTCSRFWNQWFSNRILTNFNFSFRQHFTCIVITVYMWQKALQSFNGNN